MRFGGGGRDDERGEGKNYIMSSLYNSSHVIRRNSIKTKREKNARTEHKKLRRTKVLFVIQFHG